MSGTGLTQTLRKGGVNLTENPAHTDDKEGIERLLAGDVDTGKIVRRDYINAITGLRSLAPLPSSRPRASCACLGAAGNPNARNLFGVISRFQQREGVQFEVNAVR